MGVVKKIWDSVSDRRTHRELREMRDALQEQITAVRDDLQGQITAVGKDVAALKGEVVVTRDVLLAAIQGLDRGPSR